MKRFLGHGIAAVGLAGSAFGIFTACAHDDSSIYIRGVLAPPLNAASGGGCVYTPDPAATELSTGVLDVAFATSYRGALLVANQLQARASVEQGRTETNRVNVQGVIVHVTDVGGNTINAPFTRTAIGFIDPSLGGNPSFGLVLDATMVDVTDTLRDTVKTQGPTRVIAFVKAFGVTLGGTRVESNEIQFPIDLCYGCLVKFPVTTDPFFTGGGCPASSSAQAPVVPCIRGQDQDVDCRLCSDVPDLCHPVAADAGGGG